MSEEPEQCHLCDHQHAVMAHWSSGTATRALCHESDHSCYTLHNRAGAMGRAMRLDRERGEAHVDVTPDISEFQEALTRIGKAVAWTQSQVKAISAELKGAPRKQLIHKGRKP